MLCTEELVEQVWEKGIVDANNDPRYWRKDQCGAWMSRSDYGRQGSPFGWEINCIRRQSEKDGQELPNLRPLQWNNNASMRDGGTVCVLKAVGLKNCELPPATI